MRRLLPTDLVLEAARVETYRLRRRTLRTVGVEVELVSGSVPAVLALVLVGPLPALDPGPLDVAALVQREIDQDARLERERQRCLLAQHRVRLRSRGGDSERGVWRFAQSPLDVAEDASRCALESAQ